MNLIFIVILLLIFLIYQFQKGGMTLKECIHGVLNAYGYRYIYQISNLHKPQILQDITNYCIP